MRRFQPNSTAKDGYYFIYLQTSILTFYKHIQEMYFLHRIPFNTNTSIHKFVLDILLDLLYLNLLYEGLPVFLKYFIFV
jgi:hypothetical protein